MKAILLLLLCGALAVGTSHAATTWQDSLRAMPLPAGTPLLNRDNAVAVLLNAFRSNDVVKALIVLPAISDDFYLIHRDQPKLNLRAVNLLDALSQLTNATSLRIAFREPFLLAYLPGDRLEPSVLANDPDTVAQLKTKRALTHGVFADAHWERLQPRLASELKRHVAPPADSRDAWHFARHNFAGFNLTGWELVMAVSLSGNTTATVQKGGIIFRERAGH